MSEQTKRKLEIMAVIASVIISILSGLTAVVLLPYRVSAAENEISKLQAEAKADHDAITRIDGRTERMEKTLDRLTLPPVR